MNLKFESNFVFLWLGVRLILAYSRDLATPQTPLDLF